MMCFSAFNWYFNRKNSTPDVWRSFRFYSIYIVKFSFPSRWSQISFAVLVISFYYYEITYYSLDLWLLLKTIGVGRLKYVFVHEVIFPNIYILLSIIYYVPPLTIINSLVTIVVVSKARQTLSNFIEIIMVTSKKEHDFC